jgi:hypothetical protein
MAVNCYTLVNTLVYTKVLIINDLFKTEISYGTSKKADYIYFFENDLFWVEK